jgi:hypothetical protein
MSVYIGRLVMDNNTEEKTKRERRGTGLTSCVEEGKIKRDLISETVVRGQFYSILFFSFPDKSESYADSHRDPILHRNAKTKYRNFETNIPRKGISGSQSQFPHSCVCD